MGILTQEGGVVYLLTAPSGKRYVGQTWDLPKRMANYRRGDGRGQPALHHAITKYGWENFRVTVLACGIQTQSALDAAEDAFIMILGTLAPTGYNLRRGGCGGKMSAEARGRMSASKRGVPKSPEHREALAVANRRPERRAAVSARMSGENHPRFGKKHTAETKAKISAAAKGRKATAESRAINSAAQRVRHASNPMSAETREKIAAAKRGVPKSPEHRAKIAATLRGRKLSPEHVAKAAAANRGRKRSPEARARMSAAAKAYYARKREGNS